MTALMDQQFAVDTLVALPPQPPYPFTAVATVCPLEGRERDNTENHKEIKYQYQTDIRQCGSIVVNDESPTVNHVAR